MYTSLNMHICLYVHMFICGTQTRANTHPHTHSSTYLHTFIPMYLHTYTSPQLNAWLPTLHACIHIYSKCMHTCMHTYSYTRIYIHTTYAGTCIHAQVLTSAFCCIATANVINMRKCRPLGLEESEHLQGNTRSFKAAVHSLHDTDGCELCLCDTKGWDGLHFSWLLIFKGHSPGYTRDSPTLYPQFPLVIASWVHSWVVQSVIRLYQLFGQPNYTSHQLIFTTICLVYNCYSWLYPIRLQQRHLITGMIIGSGSRLPVESSARSAALVASVASVASVGWYRRSVAGVNEWGSVHTIVIDYIDHKKYSTINPL